MNLKRFKLVGVIFIVALGLVMVRLVDLVLIKGETYLRLATANRFYTQDLRPDRGLILDLAGKPLALNLPNYYFVQKPKSLFSPLTPISRLQALEMLATDSAQVKKESVRAYPTAEALAQTVGFLRPVTKEDLQARPELKLDDKVGQMGLEKVFDQRLRGRPGRAVWEVDALGQKHRLVEKTSPIAGENLKTTLVADLNRQAYLAMTGKTGAVVILDAETGAVLGLVSTPSFDPNLFTLKYDDPTQEAHRQASVSAWLQSRKKPFFNRAIAGTYPPGSTFKLVTALAGLESGKLDPEKTVEDQGILKVGDYQYANWYYRQYGRVEGAISLVRAIARSNDIYFYKAAEWSGPDVIAQMARQLGLGRKTGIELLGEATGLVPDPAWKSATLGEKWYLGNTYHFGIGQGDTLVTPLQLAGMVQTLVAGGKRCQPHLIQQDKNLCSNLELHQDNLNLILTGMVQACSDGGTAFPFFEYNRKQLAKLYPEADLKAKLSAGVAACKTGTAEFGPVLNEAGHRATHGWFVVYLDLSHQPIKPALAKLADFSQKIVMVVLVEADEKNPYKEGSADAAPVAKEILGWILQS